MKITNKSVLAPKGFKSAGIRAGIKKGKTNLDMAIIISEKEAIVAGTFTKNKVKAAPVLWDREVVTSSPFVTSIIFDDLGSFFISMITSLYFKSK